MLRSLAKHRNRSQLSLEHSHEEQERVSPSFGPGNAPSQYREGRVEDNYQIEQRTDLNSTRTYTNRPTIQLVGPRNSASTPTSASIDDNPDRYYQQGSVPPVPKAEPHKKKRGFFGLASKDSGKSAPQHKLGRSVSVRKKEEPPIYDRNTQQKRWSTSNPSIADESEGEDHAGTGQRTTQYAHASGPPIPGKDSSDPLRSPAHPPPLTHEEYKHGRSQLQNLNQNDRNRHPLDRKGSQQSSWERTVHQAARHSRSESTQPTPTSYHPSPSSATSTSSQPFSQKAPLEPVHQSHHQNSRPPSSQSLEPPPVSQYFRTLDYSSKEGRSPLASAAYVQGSMGPPPGQQPLPNRRSSESTQQSQQSQSREGGNYQPYNQGPQQGPVLPPNAPPSGYTTQHASQLAPQGQIYRATSQTSPMAQQGHRDQDGRSSPPPSRSRDDLSNLDVAQLLQRHDELQDKYRKVKKYYFDKDAQVLQLQNTLAHQRLAQSRTSLDDNEYSNRFQRLDGAINNLAFNLRREWRTVPPWLAPYVNRDAANQPTKEMTAVGRACISRWVVDEIFDRYFHPALDPAFSSQLKIVEKNLRRFAAPTPSEEEKDALLARISNWRLSTLDGLQEVLASSQAAENRTSLTLTLTEKLTASLSMMLKEPAPPGLDNGVQMIVELAIGVAANLPLESRDVFVEYVTPGSLVQDAWMKVESGLPPLVTPGEGPSEGEATSITSKQTEETGSIESKEPGTSGGTTANEEATKEAAMQQQQQQAVQGKKKGMFGGFMGSSGAKKGSVGGGPALPGSQAQPQAQGQQQPLPPKEDRVRFSTFMAVEVRGRSVLVKAPVYVRE